MKNKSIIILSSILVMLFILSIFIGSWDISPIEIINIFFNKTEDINKAIAILNVRLPRVLLAVSSGAILGVCGVICQSCFQNPLVDPYFLGISSGSAFGAAFAIVFSLPIFLTAPLFTFIAVLIPMFFSFRSSSVLKLLFMGIVINSVFSSGLSILKVAAEIGKLREITFWLMGSLGNTNIRYTLILLFVFIIALFFFLMQSSKIDALTLGELHAYDKVKDIRIFRLQLLFVVSILMSMSVLATGIISWVGLGVPHLSRIIWKTSASSKLLINSAFGGAILLLLCDLVIRSIIKMPLFGGRIVGELPISVATSLFGAIFLFVFLFRRSKYD